MKKLLALTLFYLLMAVPPCLGQSMPEAKSTPKKKQLFSRPLKHKDNKSVETKKPVFIEEYGAHVQELSLNKKEITACSADKTDRMIDILTYANDPQGDTLAYNYTVSAGFIMGTGRHVLWNLSGVKSGTYTITAGVDDGCGVCGKTQTRTVTVLSCDTNK